MQRVLHAVQFDQIVSIVLCANPRILVVNGNTSQSVADRLAWRRRLARELNLHLCEPQGGPAYVSTPEDFALAAS